MRGILGPHTAIVAGWNGRYDNTNSISAKGGSYEGNFRQSCDRGSHHVCGCADWAPADVAACDLVQKSAIPELMREPIKQHTPNRQFQSFDGAKISTCIFFGQRNRVHLTLQEFPNSSLTSQAFQTSTKSNDFAKFTAESRLGEKAMWWKGATEAYGYVVVKGNRILSFETRWGDGHDGVGLQEKMRPLVTDAVRAM